MPDDPPVPDPRQPDPAPPASAVPPPGPSAPPASPELAVPPAAPVSPAAAVPPAAPAPEPAFPQPESGPHPEPGPAGLGLELGPLPGVVAGVEPVAAVKRTRGRRTALILAVAAVLGVLAGGGVGYGIQRQRPPTPLPPLTGTALAQPKGVGPAAPLLPASQDRQAIYDGDLLALLVPAPKGSTHADRSWLSLKDYASQYGMPGEAFQLLAAGDFRRAAGAWWRSGEQVVYIGLTQFHDGPASFSAVNAMREAGESEDDDRYGDSQQIKGTMGGLVWGSAKPDEKPGYLPVYHGRGIARIGSLTVDVLVESPEPVASSTVMSLITKQLERL